MSNVNNAMLGMNNDTLVMNNANSVYSAVLVLRSGDNVH